MFLLQNPLRMKLLIRIVPIIQLLLFAGVVCASESHHKPNVLGACRNAFGQSIDAEQDLFEINSLFVLKPRFDAEDNLFALSIFPKYWLEETHSEWTEPEHWPLLSEAEYQHLLIRLDGVTDKGRLMSAATGGIVTNSTAYLLDRYEHAYVIRGDVTDNVRFFDVYPIHQIEGRLLKKRRYTFFVKEDLYQVLVGELNYFVEWDDYRKLKRGRIQKLLVVGPIKGYCYAGFCNP